MEPQPTYSLNVTHPPAPKANIIDLLALLKELFDDAELDREGHGIIILTPDRTARIEHILLTQ